MLSDWILFLEKKNSEMSPAPVCVEILGSMDRRLLFASSLPGCTTHYLDGPCPWTHATRPNIFIFLLEMARKLRELVVLRHGSTLVGYKSFAELEACFLLNAYTASRPRLGHSLLLVRFALSPCLSMLLSLLSQHHVCMQGIVESSHQPKLTPPALTWSWCLSHVFVWFPGFSVSTLILLK